MTLALSEDAVREILQFRDERDWSRFHNPKDLAIALTGEAAELLDVFKWSGDDLDCRGKLREQAEEVADVVIYAVLLADRIGLDLDAAVRAKIRKNALRYPAAACRRADPNEAREAAAQLQRADRARIEQASSVPSCGSSSASGQP